MVRLRKARIEHGEAQYLSYWRKLAAFGVCFHHVFYGSSPY